MADIAKFIEEIKGMTVVELNELVKALEEEFGVSAAAPVAVAAAPAAGAAAEAAEEKTEFNVKLKDIGAKKIEVIKAVREFTSLGLAVRMKLVTDCASSLPFVSTMSPRRAETTPLRVHCFTPRAVSSFCRTICRSTSRTQTQRKRRKNPPISKTSRFRTVAPGERKPSHSPI